MLYGLQKFSHETPTRRPAHAAFAQAASRAAFTQAASHAAFAQRPAHAAFPLAASRAAFTQRFSHAAAAFFRDLCPKHVKPPWRGAFGPRQGGVSFFRRRAAYGAVTCRHVPNHRPRRNVRDISFPSAARGSPPPSAQAFAPIRREPHRFRSSAASRSPSGRPRQ